MNAKMREFASPFVGQRFRLRLRILRGKPWPLPSAAFVAVVAAGQCGAIAVIHGRGVDAVFVFPAQARSGALSALIAGDGVRAVVFVLLRHRRVFLVLRS